MHSTEISLTAVHPVGLHILRELALPLRPKIIMLFLGHDDDSTVRNTKSPSSMMEKGQKLKNGCKKFHGHYSAANFSTPEFEFPA